MSGSTTSKRKTLAIAASAALAASAVGAVTAVPASGTQTGPGVRPGSNITVFHNIDFVAVFGYGPVGSPVTVRVLRRGVVIGSASGPAIDAEGLPGLEVNHGPEGAARPGDCWEGATPDIKPGDVIRVTDRRGTDQVTVDNIAFTGQPTDTAGAGDVVVPFTALLANGNPVPIGRIDSAEFRAAANNQVRFEAPNVLVEPDGSGTPGAYQMRYPSPFTPSRNDDETPFNQDQLRAALLGDGHAVGFGHVDPLPRESMLYDGLEDTPGPAPGCESAPAATNAVSSVTPQVFNRRTPANTSLRVAGFSRDATQVQVQLRDTNTTITGAATITGPVDAQTWRATFAPARLRNLSGNVQVNALIDGVRAPVGKTVIKDTAAPRRPSASLPGGSYRGNQVISLNAGASDQIRYTLGKGRQAAPRVNRGTVYRGGQIRLTSTTVLKMIAVDEARNVSPVVRVRYTLTTAPSRPRIRRASAGSPGGRDTAVARWGKPRASNGARVNGYRVTALKLRPTGAVASRRGSRMLRASARSLEMRLPAGRYRFVVRARNSMGTGAGSAESNIVRSR
jgi:Chitobiase/beta-hexosaminidase C-terminal domain